MEKRVRVSGYENEYKVSNLGRVKGFKGIMKQHEHKQGYKRLRFRDGKCYLVHRLVYLSFNNLSLDFRGQTSKTLVCHKNDIKHDNRLSNLFLGTQKDNMKDMRSKGRGKGPTRGQMINFVRANAKINYEIAEKIREDYKETGNIYKTAEKFDVSYATVSRIKNHLIRKNKL